ncbi:MAG: hypothetical protein RMM53_13880, partial [Bacteroidia bacterium]|nr:hypothetical protein [Bacteroidia bacterium]
MARSHARETPDAQVLAKHGNRKTTSSKRLRKRPNSPENLETEAETSYVRVRAFEQRGPCEISL